MNALLDIMLTLVQIYRTRLICFTLTTICKKKRRYFISTMKLWLTRRNPDRTVVSRVSNTCIKRLMTSWHEWQWHPVVFVAINLTDLPGENEKDSVDINHRVNIGVTDGGAADCKNARANMAAQFVIFINSYIQHASTVNIWIFI